MAQALLVDGKADANSKTNDLNTPLHYLVRLFLFSTIIFPEMRADVIALCLAHT